MLSGSNLFPLIVISTSLPWTAAVELGFWLPGIGVDRPCFGVADVLQAPKKMVASGLSKLKNITGTDLAT